MTVSEPVQQNTSASLPNLLAAARQLYCDASAWRVSGVPSKEEDASVAAAQELALQTFQAFQALATSRTNQAATNK